MNTADIQAKTDIANISEALNEQPVADACGMTFWSPGCSEEASERNKALVEFLKDKREVTVVWLGKLDATVSSPVADSIFALITMAVETEMTIQFRDRRAD